MISLLAQDAAPSMALGLLAQELIERKVPTTFLFGEGNKRTLSEHALEICKLVEQSKIIVLGMSSSPELSKGEMIAA